MQNLTTILAANVRAARTTQRLSQRALAQRARTTQVTISSIECGRANITLATLETLAHALNMRPDELLAQGEEK